MGSVCGALLFVVATAGIADVHAATVDATLVYDGYWVAADPSSPFDTYYSSGFNGPVFERTIVVKASETERAVLEFDLGTIAAGQ